MAWRTRKRGKGRQVGLRFKTGSKAITLADLTHNRFERNLALLPVTNVNYSRDRIDFMYDGELISNQIEIVPHEAWVGSWDRGRQVIYIDDDVPEEYRDSLAVHESVEKYLKERYGLDENAEGHEIAEEVERRYFLRTHSPKEWDEYMRIVERIHRKESGEQK